MTQDTINFAGQVAIVTGAGGGLGRLYALDLAARGAAVVVNDLGGSVDGSGSSASAAETVVEEIKAAGGKAIANAADVTDEAAVNAMVADTIAAFGRVDILINNAGILRDKSFAKMEMSNWNKVVDVHLNGAALCTKAVWNVMKEQGYGRIIMTTSPSGIYGNFGQANYGAAKAGLWGMMNTLGLEGAKSNIHINCIAPSAGTRMTETIMDAGTLKMLAPENITPAVIFLCSEAAPSRKVLVAAAGTYTLAEMVETQGIHLAEGDRTPEAIAANWGRIADRTDAEPVNSAMEGVAKLVKAMANA
ncbi:NAD(P)-dependent dehydrogenase, short-chain alcohol dehydrogenase family [Pseudovibrio ascidiaceicola]|uniref:NAD(P)-dependent dehydrogenase, short-chain alcohol dehydrogenase family n=1 Tax=Pseudovibrio ascidiaceicola TaxID=285279 RepID=A0A1I4DJX0_9HYPH|nr:SDR family NAD(P)-dependent oxidoreductase [Pseudovibrio ascidiaceicola]SFK93575.1 NAD(P)-dependent dehydrogenase, short-chain alcohol dehydrogenase family [Pseudovibrio ascidiaceicola]